MRLHLVVGMVGLLGALGTTEAKADDWQPPPDTSVRHPSKKAFSAGIALTSTGASFLATGIGLEALTAVLVAEDHSGGMGALMGLVMGSALAGALGVVGLSTLVPGIVLMVLNRPVKLHTDDLVRDAHAQPPLPGFTSVPILTARF